MVNCNVTSVSTVLCPAGGAGADVMSREAEGQQGTEQLPVVEKFSSVGRNSLDVFSPAREGQMLPSLPPQSVLPDTRVIKGTTHDLHIKSYYYLNSKYRI